MALFLPSTTIPTITIVTTPLRRVVLFRSLSITPVAPSHPQPNRGGAAPPSATTNRPLPVTVLPRHPRAAAPPRRRQPTDSKFSSRSSSSRSSSSCSCRVEPSRSSNIRRSNSTRAAAAVATNSSSSSSSSRRKNQWTVDPHTGWVTPTTTRSDASFNGTDDGYQVIVGLEIHAQLHGATKLFSPAQTSNNNNSSSSIPPPNHASHTHAFDLALPGVLPVLASPRVVQAAVLVAAALQCRTIYKTSRFERKHYVYADLPHGYQITQQTWPLARNGILEYTSPSNSNTSASTSTKHGKSSSSSNKNRKTNKVTTTAPQLFQCRVNRVQIEQDTGKTTTIKSKNDNDSNHKNGGTVVVSRVDFNRAGVALVEIVTEPDLRSSDQAASAVRTLQQLLQYTRTCLGRMQDGQLRIDCNVNIVPKMASFPSHTAGNDTAVDDKPPLPPRSAFPRVEVKNLNSIQQVYDCIQYEAARQAEILHALETPIDDDTAQSNASSNPPHDSGGGGGGLYIETRTWNASTHQTELIRRKDGDEDYRFLPDPDLPPLILNADSLNGCVTVSEFVAQHLPELPAAAMRRLVADYGLSDYQAQVIAGGSDASATAFFDTAMAVAYPDAQKQSIHDDDDTNNDPRNRVLQTNIKNSHKDRTVVATTLANLMCNELFALIKKHHNPSEAIVSSRRQHDDANIFNTNHNDNENIHHHDYMEEEEPVACAVVESSNVSARQLGEIVRLIQTDTISKTMAKQLLSHLYTAVDNTNNNAYVDPHRVALDQGWVLVSDRLVLRDICRAIVEAHPDEVHVARSKGGKFVTKIHKLLTGKAMAASRGTAHPERLQEVLSECLDQAMAEKRPGLDDSKP